MCKQKKGQPIGYPIEKHEIKKMKSINAIPHEQR